MYISVSRTGGGFRFEGQDLNPNPFGSSEYEYAITVLHSDVPKVLEALGGQPDDDVLDLIEENAEMIVRAGEKTWLESVGISPGFWSHV